MSLTDEKITPKCFDDKDESSLCINRGNSASTDPLGITFGDSDNCANYRLLGECEELDARGKLQERALKLQRALNRGSEREFP